MNENDVPEHLWPNIQALMSAFETTEAKGDEGTIRASINVMTDIEVKEYIKRVETL